MKEKKRVLILGVSGLLGNNLAQAWRHDMDVYGSYHQHAVFFDGIKTLPLNLLDEKALRNEINTIRPDYLVNCAALTNIDYCEDHPEESRQLNVDLVRHLVEAIDEQSIKLIHFSTDNLFDGVKGNYTEVDDVSPTNVYGQTKYEGEIEALKHPEAVVARINIFGWNVQEKCSLAEWGIRELSRGKKIKGFTDALFCSTYTYDLAKILQQALDINISGLIHMVSSSTESKYDFLMTLADLFGFDQSLIEPTSLDAFDFRARRGKNLSLSVKKLSNLINDIPTVKQSLYQFYMDSLAKSIK